jgi:sugar O-acyltransferase (sialic acid O-acetyltransferase NeuD family)
VVKKLVLIGAGGFGREVAASLVRTINWHEPTYEFLGFLDDGTQFHTGSSIDGYPWLGNRYWILDHKDEVYCTCTVGNANLKKQIQSELMQQGVQFETIIEKTAYIAPHTTLGSGCVLYGGVKVSVNCNIGAGVLLNDGVKIGHDVTIGDYTSIMPDTGISGGCQIGEQVDIGGHAFIIPRKKVGDRAHIAAGSIVFSNVRAGTTVLGNPAKRMKEIE